MSSTTLYDRAWSIRIATDAEERTWDSPVEPGDHALNIGFKIQKNADLKSNDCELTMTNLSPASRALMVKNANVEVKAGYRGSIGLIFKGVIEFVSHQKQGPDWVTTITARDGSLQWREQGIAVTFKKGTPIQTVVQKLFDTINEKPAVQGFGLVNQGIKGALTLVPVKVFSTATKTTAKPKNAPPLTAQQKAAQKASKAKATQQRQAAKKQDAANMKLERARTFRGVAMAKLEILTKAYGLKAIWEDQSLSVVPEISFTDGEVISLTVDSGLIGSPEPIEKGGWRVVTLLRHEFKLFRPVSVTAAEVEGLFKITRIEHTGERKGNEWFTILEVQPVA